MFVFAETFNRSVVVNVVIEQEYDENFEDKKSSEYKEFVGNFTIQVNGKWMSYAGLQPCRYWTYPVSNS